MREYISFGPDFIKGGKVSNSGFKVSNFLFKDWILVHLYKRLLIEKTLIPPFEVSFHDSSRELSDGLLLF